MIHPTSKPRAWWGTGPRSVPGSDRNRMPTKRVTQTGTLVTDYIMPPVGPAPDGLLHRRSVPCHNGSLLVVSASATQVGIVLSFPRVPTKAT